MKCKVTFLRSQAKPVVVSVWPDSDWAYQAIHAAALEILKQWKAEFVRLPACVEIVAWLKGGAA